MLSVCTALRLLELAGPVDERYQLVYVISIFHNLQEVEIVSSYFVCQVASRFFVSCAFKEKMVDCFSALDVVVLVARLT